MDWVDGVRDHGRCGTFLIAAVYGSNIDDADHATRDRLGPIVATPITFGGAHIHLSAQL